MIDIKYLSEEQINLVCKGHIVSITEYSGSFVISVTDKKGTSVIHTREIIQNKDED